MSLTEEVLVVTVEQAQKKEEVDEKDQDQDSEGTENWDYRVENLLKEKVREYIRKGTRMDYKEKENVC